MATQQQPTNDPTPATDAEMEDQSVMSDDDCERLRLQMRGMQVQQEGEVRALNLELTALRAEMSRILNIQNDQQTLQQNQTNDLNNLATTATTGRDPGEILKPSAPEKFDGNARKLQMFLTTMNTFFSYYPTQFRHHFSKVHYAAGRLTDNAALWFEPVMRNYNDYEITEQDERTRRIYGDYAVFEQELRQAFGTIDEKSKAEDQIKTLKQLGSASDYGTLFVQLAIKLPHWGQDALMSLFFDGLKQSVQEELYKSERPATLVEYIGQAVKIDDRQFSWRKKKNPSAGNNKRYQQPRYNANQGRQRQNNTSYGTNSGPMELGAAKRDHSQVLCWNCGKKGHFESKCRNPNKTNQKFKPIPEGKKHLGNINRQNDGKTLAATMVTTNPVDHDERRRYALQHRTTCTDKDCYVCIDGKINKYLEPQEHALMHWTACYDDNCLVHKDGKDNGYYPQKKTLAMARSGYDMKGTPANTVLLATQALYKDKKEAEHDNVNTNVQLDTHASLRKRTHAKYATWRPIPESSGNQLNNQGKALAMVRKGKTPSPTGSDHVYDEDRKRYVKAHSHSTNPRQDSYASRSNVHDNLDMSPADQDLINLVKREFALQQGNDIPQPFLTVSDFDRAKELGLQVTTWHVFPDSLNNEQTTRQPRFEERLYESPTEGSVDDTSSDEDESQAEQTRQLYDKIGRGQNVNAENFYVHGINHRTVQGTHNDDLPREGDAPILHPTHPDHATVSWISCYDKKCDHHLKEKVMNDCYPTRLGPHAVTKWYHASDLQQRRVVTWMNHLNVAILIECAQTLPTKCMDGRHDVLKCRHHECVVHEREKIAQWHRKHPHRPTQPRTVHTPATEHKEKISAWLKDANEQAKNDKRRL
jgi:hypothetical protein